MIKKNKGITLISLIITVIVIIILASIAIFSGFDAPTSALFSDFTTEVNNLKISLSTYRAKNLIDSDENSGFTQVSIKNAPSDFISFPNDSGDVIGYVIDINKLDYTTETRGYGAIQNNTVSFDVDDVYVYDKNGTVFYVKGYENEDKVYYNSITYKIVKGG